MMIPPSTQTLQCLYHQALRLHIPAEDIPTREIFEQLGINSVQVMEILITLSETYDIHIDPSSFDINLLNNLEALSQHLNQLIQTTDLL